MGTGEWIIQYFIICKALAWPRGQHKTENYMRHIKIKLWGTFTRESIFK